MRALVNLAGEVAARFQDTGPDSASHFTRDTLQTWKESGQLETELDSMSPNHFAGFTASISRQTETHMKWFIYRSSQGVEIWLHEFRPDREIQKTDRYAASVHNHRYGFSSVLLKGGYTAEYHKVVALDGGMKNGAHVEDTITDAQPYCAGDAYLMHYDEFHRLRDFAPGTVSFVVQLPPQAVSSFSVDQGTKTLIEHVNFGNDRERMRRAYA